MDSQIPLARALSVTKVPIVTHILSPEFESVYLIPLADMQIGDPGFYEGLFVSYRDWILERPNAYALLMGDMFEQPVVGNRASDFWDMHLIPAEAKKKAKELLRPLVDNKRLLGAVDGNHEYRAYKATGYSPLKTVLDEFNLPTEGTTSIYDPEALVVRIAFGTDRASSGRFIYKIYFSHGWGGARRTGAHVNKTEELAAVVTNADVYVLGHEHTLFVSRWDSGYIPEALSATECKPTRQLFVGAGTFCRYSKFQKRIQRRLPNLGAPRIRLEGISGHRSHKDIHVSI